MTSMQRVLLKLSSILRVPLRVLFDLRLILFFPFNTSLWKHIYGIFTVLSGNFSFPLLLRDDSSNRSNRTLVIFRVSRLPCKRLNTIFLTDYSIRESINCYSNYAIRARIITNK